MLQFTATILQFAQQGEKTGWSYIKIPAGVAVKLKPGNKKSFRVKGSLDDHPIKRMALLPMGDGNFIMALNATVRKAIRKNKGATLKVKIDVDAAKISPPAALLACLADEPPALDFFNTLTPGHRNYFGAYIRSAKTEPTRATRIAHCVNALAKKMDFGQMLRSLKQDRKDLLG